MFGLRGTAPQSNPWSAMNHLAIVIALVGVIGIGAQWIAWRSGLPAIALMLVAGIIAAWSSQASCP
ncbi:hypothetical protein GCM10009106_13100 [Sphingomonas japonica]